MKRILVTMTLVAGVLTLSTPAEATFPGANGLIAFQREHDTGSQIATMNADGTGVTEVTSGPGYAVTPVWSPDGTKIAFTRGMSLLVIPAGGGPELPVSGCADGWPVWSPDGTRIAFSNGCSLEISSVNADGTGSMTDLTHTDGVFNVPRSWSPDGSKIAFTRWSRGTYQDVWILNVDGSGETNLTNTPDQGEALPDWSPDGSKIAFGGGYGDIHIMPSNGSGSAQNLTNTPGAEEGAPSWSPDGTLIAYEATDPAYTDTDVYVMGSDGSGQTNITSRSDGDDRWPRWQTVPAPPPNDDIQNATEIVSLPYADGPYSTILATTDLDPPDPDCAGNGPTVWYQLVAPSDMQIRADTFGSEYDTTLSVYSGPPDVATQVACNDDYDSLQSQVIFQAHAGETYRFMVGAYGSGSGGSLMFAVSDIAPPEGAIAFERIEWGNSEIFILSGSRYANLTDHPARDINPAISPDGMHIVFASDRAGTMDLWLMDADGSRLRQLTNTPDDDWNPGWSPDGRRMTFLRREASTGNFEVYVMNLNGTGTKNLTKNPALDAQPSFTSDGREILFVRDWDIWIMSASGGNQRPAVTRPGFDEWPHMARGRIVFHSTWAGSYDLWSARASGKELRRLTFDDFGNEAWPVGSPDGSMIAYQDDGVIATANADGSDAVALIEGDFPSWSIDTL